MKIESKKIQQDEFIHLLAARANFTIADTEEFFKALKELFLEAVQSGVEISIRGFGDLKYTTIAERTVAKTPHSQEPVTYPATKKVMFKLAENYRNVLKKDYGKIKK
jgi:nucleoid DNA-binding protein